MPKRIIGDDFARLMSKIDKSGSCWYWLGAVTSTGYGNFYLQGKYLGAHKAVYQMLIGPVPEGLELDHLCRVRACVNPDHLEPVTHRENDLRGVGVSAVNIVKTHCDQGHPFNERNTYHRPDKPSTRDCRRCRADAEARRRARMRIVG